MTGKYEYVEPEELREPPKTLAGEILEEYIKELYYKINKGELSIIKVNKMLDQIINNNGTINI